VQHRSNCWTDGARSVAACVACGACPRLFSACAAMGTTQDCRRQIHRELRYQSSMDLDAGTYAAIRCECRALSAVTPCALTLTVAHVAAGGIGSYCQSALSISADSTCRGWSRVWLSFARPTSRLVGDVTCMIAPLYIGLPKNSPKEGQLGCTVSRLSTILPRGTSLLCHCQLEKQGSHCMWTIRPWHVPSQHSKACPGGPAKPCGSQSLGC